MPSSELLARADAYATHVDNPSFKEGSALPDAIRVETITLLLSGWSPPRISRHILQVFEVEVSPTHVMALLDALPEELFVPDSDLSVHLKINDFEVDALTVAARAIRVTENRLASFLAMETSEAVLQEHATELTRLLARQCAEYLSLKMKMGLLPQRESAIPFALEPEGILSVAEILMKYAVQREGLPADSREAAG